MWPLSSYGPAKHEPVVIGGLDESPEELRLKAVTALKAGTTDEYVYAFSPHPTPNSLFVRRNMKGRRLQLQIRYMRMHGTTSSNCTSKL